MGPSYGKKNPYRLRVICTQHVKELSIELLHLSLGVRCDRFIIMRAL